MDEKFSILYLYLTTSHTFGTYFIQKYWNDLKEVSKELTGMQNDEWACISI